MNTLVQGILKQSPRLIIENSVYVEFMFYHKFQLENNLTTLQRMVFSSGSLLGHEMACCLMAPSH